MYMYIYDNKQSLMEWHMIHSYSFNSHPPNFFPLPLSQDNKERCIIHIVNVFSNPKAFEEAAKRLKLDEEDRKKMVSNGFT